MGTGDQLPIVLLLIAFVAIGTAAIVLVARLASRVLDKIIGDKKAEQVTTQSLTPHEIMETAGFLAALVIPPLILLAMNFPVWRIGYRGVAVWVLIIVAEFAISKALLRSERYRNSWWCAPIGSRKRASRDD